MEITLIMYMLFIKSDWISDIQFFEHQSKFIWNNTELDTIPQ